MKLIKVFLIVFSLIGCNNSNSNKDLKPILKYENKLTKFIDKIKNNDTLIIRVNGSVCQGRRFEEDIFIKKNDSIYLQTKIVSDRLKDSVKILNSIQYKYLEMDTLNFENFILYLKMKKELKTEQSSIIVQEIYKKDTLTFFSEQLNDRLKTLSYYENIKRLIYPNESFYKIPNVPIK